MADIGSNRDQVDLVEYVTSLERSIIWMPDQLVLPRPLAESISQLYTASDTVGLENGFQVLFDREARRFSTGPVCVGERGSVNVGVPQADTVGGAHGHPIATFGYEGGFPAHSPQDITLLATTTETKQYFIDFVSCGEWIYAMIQHDNSLWTAAATKYLDDCRALEKEVMSEALERAGKDSESYQALLMEMLELKKQEEEMVENGEMDEAQMDRNRDARQASFNQMFFRKAGMGKVVENLTTDCCATFAKRFNYFFYAGKGNVLSSITPDTRSRLQRL